MKKSDVEKYEEQLKAQKEIADLLYERYMENVEYGSYFVEEVKRMLWGKIVDNHVPIFLKVWDILNEHGNIGRKNRYVYGDIDVGVWIEKVKEPKNKKVIVSTCYCSGAEDNTHIYILEIYSNWTIFKCRTVWPKESCKGGYAVKKSKEHPDGWFRWGDDRDISIPSLKTYQNRDFNFGYGDSRDKGNVFSFEKNNSVYIKMYDYFSETYIKMDSYFSEYDVSYALDSLRTHLAMLNDYNENRC